MWCDRGQEAFVNVDLFQTTTNYSSFISLWLKMDDLNKARYPRMTQRATKRVPVLFMWCDRGQEAFVNVDLFQTTTNDSSFISLWLKMSFHRIFFLLSLLSLV